MSKNIKQITTILIVNIIALSGALIFITVKKLQPKPKVETIQKVETPQINKPESNYKIGQWKIIGQLNNQDLLYDFKNGLGGELGVGTKGQLLDGESIWVYSNKLRQLLTTANNKERKYAENDEHTLGYVAIINRVSKNRIDNPTLWKAFPITIGDYRFNIVKPLRADLLKDPKATKLYDDSRKEVDAFFKSLEADKTAKKD